MLKKRLILGGPREIVFHTPAPGRALRQLVSAGDGAGGALLEEEGVVKDPEKRKGSPGWRTGVISFAVAKSWKCRLGLHKFVRRHNSGDPNEQICVRCRKQRTRGTYSWVAVGGPY